MGSLQHRVKYQFLTMDEKDLSWSGTYSPFQPHLSPFFLRTYASPTCSSTSSSLNMSICSISIHVYSAFSLLPFQLPSDIVWHNSYFISSVQCPQKYFSPSSKVLTLHCITIRWHFYYWYCSGGGYIAQCKKNTKVLLLICLTLAPPHRQGLYVLFMFIFLEHVFNKCFLTNPFFLITEAILAHFLEFKTHNKDN